MIIDNEAEKAANGFDAMLKILAENLVGGAYVRALNDAASHGLGFIKIDENGQASHIPFAKVRIESKENDT